MTGTSIDGLDLALVRVDGCGLEMRGTLVRHVSRSLGALAGELRAAAEQRPMTAREFASLAWRFGELHAEAIAEAAAGAPIDLVVAHGQTVVHAPPISWQLLNPAPIAARLHCRVACDLRQADLAAGGQGAPITPIADWVLFRDATKRRAIVNLGGFCNVTVLPAEHGGSVCDIRGMDVCACNHVLDAVARAVLGAPYDADGAAAASGRVDASAVAALGALLAGQREAGRSLGTGDEAAAWIESHRSALSPFDLAASAVEAVAAQIAAAIGAHHVDEIIVAGGGARNRTLVQAIARAAGIALRATDDLGIPIEAREATAMAVLGVLAEDGVEITCPGVTGRTTRAGRAGAWCG